jgi:hypothetical protein
MHRVCCCDGCPTDCCDFWACSPTAPITVTISGSTESTSECDQGQTLTTETVFWQITATMTRVGTDCASYRYVASQGELEYTKTIRTYETTNGGVCDAPPGPCDYTHCDDCQCRTPEARPCIEETWTYNGTAYGGGADCVTATIYEPMIPTLPKGQKALLTIACFPGVCTPCAEPVLIITLDDRAETQPALCNLGGSSVNCGSVDATYTVTCLNCCDFPGCSSTTVEAICLPAVVMHGTGCLNATTFDNAFSSHLLGFGGAYANGQYPGFWFPESNGCWPAEQGVTIDTCNYFNGDEYFATWQHPIIPNDPVFWCYKLDASTPEGYSFLCDAGQMSCTCRHRRVVQWTM